MKRIRIVLSGRIQGVGCRPFVYRQARDLGLTGWVCNDTRGVTIEVQGESGRIDEFVGALNHSSKLPAMMKLSSLVQRDLPMIPGETDFTIRHSDSLESLEITEVSADTAVCADCLREMNDPNDFRYRYPFINCTNCGPRYSIIRTVPYDRCNTTMSIFTMCNSCHDQYVEVSDRRFHAQPVACPACGPKIWLTDNHGDIIESIRDEAIRKAARMLLDGKVLAIKGLGGFHLAADAHNQTAVSTLRQRKQRDDKPFAMMATLKAVKKYVSVDAIAVELLSGPKAPIVLLEKNPAAAESIAPSVAMDTSSLGFMLPYAPLHHLLFAEPGIELLVMTSANIADEPLISDNDEAIRKLSSVADAFVMHDRDIFRQLDDSVVHIIDNGPALIRRARGYVPEPIWADVPAEAELFAAGADLKNTFCLVKGSQFILSEHIGDLADGLVYRHYLRSVKHLQQLLDVKPTVVACDLHPGYLSTQYAQSQNIERVIPIQHHYAHFASVLAGSSHQGPAIGLIADGTGLGTDNAIWGCECLVGTLPDIRRFGHLRYFPLAGGDAASREAIRPVMGLLGDCCRHPTDFSEFDGLLDRIEPDKNKRRMITEQISRGINTVPTSSLGRVFDAVAAIVGLGNINRYEAQLPMALEAKARKEYEDEYPFELYRDDKGLWQFDIRPMIRTIVADVYKNRSKEQITTAFHRTVANGLFAMARQVRVQLHLDAVALSGGVFCNRFLANRLIALLKADGFTVLWNRQIPVNDGGVALGQAAIAAAMIRRESKLKG